MEKDSLFADFQSAAKALGARTVYSGKGKSSKAAIEKVLREHFGWKQYYEEWENDPFEDEPLYIIHVSDFDYDGEKVIGPTFGTQASRYTGNIREARIGVNPHNLLEAGYSLNDRWYQIKISNKAYKEWAGEKAVGLAVCQSCNQITIVNHMRDSIRNCEACGGESTVIVDQKNYYGFEVESMRTREYYALVVDALLRILPFEYIIQKLREECVANAYRAAESLVDEVLADNESYQELLSELEKYEEMKRKQENFEQKILDEIQQLAEDHVSDWEHIEDDPTPDDYKEHVQTAGEYTGPWRPFSPELRTARLIDFVRDEYEEDLQAMREYTVE